MLQVAMHTYPDGVNDYNPTQAGANPYWPSSVLGAACNGSGIANIFSSMLDYNRNSSGRAPVPSVFNGELQLDAYTTPYVIRTWAQWIPTGGSPAYYLRLQQWITNYGEESYVWGFDLAAYAAADLTTSAASPACTQGSPCTQSQFAFLAGGYTSGSLTDGLAVGVPAQSSLMTTFNGLWYYSRGSYDTHLFFANEGVPPGQQKIFAWYVMPGYFAAAQAFMQNHS